MKYFFWRKDFVKNMELSLKDSIDNGFSSYEMKIIYMISYTDNDFL